LFAWFLSITFHSEKQQQQETKNCQQYVPKALVNSRQFDCPSV